MARTCRSEDENGDRIGRTDDGRYVVVDGRRWRATDPSIPEPLRQALVRELMSARRAVRSAGDDADAVTAARSRVHDAKVALGERGHPWWEDADSVALRDRAAAAIRSLTRDRGADKTICPSEAARAIASPEWRPAMDQVRSVGRQLAAEGDIEVTQRGRTVDPETATGAIRYRLAGASPRSGQA